MHAQCQCGQLSAAISGTTDQIVACHCIECQRRSGSPFGVIAYYPAAAVALSGEAREFSRIADSGKRFTTCFCPHCGTTVWCVSEAKPDAIGIPVGTLADPAYPAPARSVYERSMHSWVTVPGKIPHFPGPRT
jgi:hypothetical protein